MGETATLEQTEVQTPLLDISGKKYNPNWVDPKQQLFVPTAPLHYKAHRLQVILEVMDKRINGDSKQFNADNYLKILNEYTRCVELIGEGKTKDESVDSGGLGQNNTRSKAPSEMGEGVAASMGVGISADNPLAG